MLNGLRYHKRAPLLRSVETIMSCQQGNQTNALLESAVHVQTFKGGDTFGGAELVFFFQNKVFCSAAEQILHTDRTERTNMMSGRCSGSSARWFLDLQPEKEKRPEEKV